MSNHCPTCHQPVPEKMPLPVRIRALLAESPYPLPARDIRVAMGATQAVIYQTLARMRDRGEIRKQIIPGRGGNPHDPGDSAHNGWVLVPEEEGIPDLRSTDDRRQDHLVALIQYLQARGEMHVDSATSFLVNLGCDPEEAEVLVEAAVETHAIQRGADLIWAEKL